MIYDGMVSCMVSRLIIRKHEFLALNRWHCFGVAISAFFDFTN